jgi:hypothetical protein
VKHSATFGWSLILFFVSLLGGCASTEDARLKRVREAFIARDSDAAAQELLSESARGVSESQVLHLLDLGRISFVKGDYAGAVEYFHTARTLSNEARGEWKSFFNDRYSGTPWEYSWIHTASAISYSVLADQSADQSLAADFRRKARAEMMLADSHLENLKRIFGGEKRYQEDPYARLVGALVHESTGQRADLRIAEILANQVPQGLSAQLKASFKNKGQSTWAFVDLGILPQLKKRKVVVGLSTLFSAIEDPGLRRIIERVGLQVLIQLAPEFGLVALGSAAVGAVEHDSQGDEPLYLTSAIDQAVGLILQIPWMPPPKGESLNSIELTLEYQKNELTQGNTTEMIQVPLKLVCDYQGLIHEEYRAREGVELKKQAITMGLKYLAILLPAIEAYRRAEGEGAGLKKLGILAGFYIAKRAIDLANAPDLRSWDLLPQFSYAGNFSVPPGSYRARVGTSAEGASSLIRDVGLVEVRQGQRFFVVSDPAPFDPTVPVATSLNAN